MKKLFLFSLCFVIVIGKLSAQDNTNDSKFRFGLKMAPAFAWMKPDDKKKLTNDGVALKFAYGLVTEFRINSVASLSTGIEVNYSGGRMNFANQADSNYYDPSEYTVPKAGTIDRFFISKRNYKITYVDLPILLKMKTPEVNGFTYFGQFGINLSVRAKVKANDVGTLVTYRDSSSYFKRVNTINDYEIPDLIITKDMSFFRAGLNIGGGAEYRIAGNTSMFASVNFQNGFTNVLKAESKVIRSQTKNNQNFLQNAKTNFFQLNVGILF
ncbi:MAG: outer membrane beta-barrel protein [Bacteroidia bacterium]|nr:outer membrane beta-barrel protein [Bacteroidia bacterium]MCZ2247322.1 PorT family protein [Bacteroidia bacterium]